MKTLIERAKLVGQVPITGQYAFVQTLIFLLGFLLRLHGTGSLPLTFDEGATDYFAHLPLSDLWGPAAWLETNPPLFYTIEREIVLLFGNGPSALRLVSILAGALCIPVAALIAQRQGGRSAGVAAALLVATSAVSIERSQEARAYSMLTLAALVAIAAEVSVLQAYHRSNQCGERASASAWACYILASIAALYLHNTAILMVIVLNLVAAFVWVTMLGMRGRLAGHWITANAVILVAYAAWMPIVVHQSVHTLAAFWISVPTLMDLRYAVMKIYAQPFMPWFQPFSDLLFLVFGLAGILAYRSNRILLGLAVFVVLGVPLLTWVVSQWRPLTNGKTLAWLVPVFVIFVALGSTYIRRLARPSTVLLVGIQAIACFSYFQTGVSDAYPEMAQKLRALALDGDVIYLQTPDHEILLSYYGWPRERLRVYAPGPIGWFRNYDGTVMTAKDFEQQDHNSRVWVLTRNHPDLHRDLVDHLDTTMTEALDYRLRGLELSLLVPR